MDKNAIKKFAVWARRELIERVSQRAAIYGITSEDYGEPEAESVNGKLLSASEKNQRRILINSIREKGFEQVIEEVAYTWFNRFAALRFMEVNGYLPSHIRVFTNEAGEFKPQILTEAIHLDLEGLNKDKVYELEKDNKTEELFKYLLVIQCNALNSILPGMFQRIDDYTELLLPDNLLREGSVIEKLVVQGTSDSIPESDWTDQVQIIGWLYQYYNVDIYNEIYDGDNSKRKIEKSQIPAATQLFTPDWVVHYMAENSLGRMWLEGHSNSDLKDKLKFYVDDANQSTDVLAKLGNIRKGYSDLKPNEIRVIDPCMGSGHILCVIFDLLINIYEDCGYTAREAANCIIENNLWGLDIDDRASQLSYFTVMMKARQYDRRFLMKGIQPHIFSIQESNAINPEYINYFVNGDKNLEKALNSLVTDLYNAKEYGSILKIRPVNFKLLYNRIKIMREDPQALIYTDQIIKSILPIIQVGEALAQQYEIVITNPPYLSCSRFDGQLADYVVNNYKDEKSDLATVMLNRMIFGFAKDNGFIAAITTCSWMFIHSFIKFREKLLKSVDFINLVDFGTELFDGKIGHLHIVSWVNRKSKTNSLSRAIRLVDFCYSRRDEKESEFFNKTNYYSFNQSNFDAIPDKPIAYWVSQSLVDDFLKGIPFSKIGFPKVGMQTSNNDKYLRLWVEVNQQEFFSDSKKWIKYVKGGPYRKWYGNLEFVVWYNGTPSHILKQKNARVLPESELTVLKCTWSDVANTTFACRVAPIDSFHDISGHCFYPANEDDYYYLLGLANSCVFQEIINLLNSSIHYQVGDVGRVPVLKDAIYQPIVIQLVKICIDITKSDWDSYEISWDFKNHPFITFANNASVTNKTCTLQSSYEKWCEYTERQFSTLKANEEELNRIFIDIYGLQDELSPEIEDKNITVRKADLQRDIKSFISYAVGCMFGRYSLDVPGLVYAGGTWDPSKYTTFHADPDAILPICDDEYFEDDIVGLFITFVEKVYGKETLEENLQFIADSLNGKGTSREIIRNYFINNFFKDHCAKFTISNSGKRPIYWLFDSGKKNGFKCLIYIHRYKPDTIARIRTDYIHEQQSRYRTAIEDLNHRIDGASPSEKVKLNKQLTKVMDQAEELRVYEEKIHHLADQMIEIDLDDGVKVNYAKFQDVLAEIK